MYFSLAIAFLGALVLSALLTPVFRNVALRMNLVDHPDGGRKLHRQPIPRVGGIPIWFAIAAACIALAFLPWAGTRAVAAALSHWQFLAVLGLVFITGFADDLVGLQPRQKLMGLVLTAGLAFACGIRISSCGSLHLPIWLSLPVTILWLVGCATAFNLIDGLDGLATGLALFSTLGMLLSASLLGLDKNYLVALVLVPLAGSLLGFLPYNFSPASIFLGDSGSLMIGFLLGSSSVLLSQRSNTLLGMTAPVFALAIPLLDVILSIARRFLRGRPIFSADRGHIHHRLLDLGLSPRYAALLLYGAGLLAAAFSVAQTVASEQIGVPLILLFCVGVWLGIQSLGYTEFTLFGHMMLPRTLQHSLNAHLNLLAVDKSLRTADSIEECWTAICDGCRLFGFAEARLRVADQIRHKRFTGPGVDPGWNIRIPLPGGDYINFTRPQDSTVHPMGVAPFLDLIRKVMTQRCLAEAEFVPALARRAAVYDITRHPRRATEQV